MGKASTLGKRQRCKESQIDSHSEADSDEFLECRRPKRSRQHGDTQHSVQLLACPFAKHSPSDVSQICFHGWQSIARLKEHLGRRHKPLSTIADFKTSAFSPSCDGPCLNEEAYEKLRCRKQDSLKTWTQIYEAIFPDALKIPSPFVEHHDHPLGNHKSSIHEFSQIICDGLNNVIPSFGQISCTALAECLRHYIQNEEHNYIDYLQNNASERSSTSWVQPGQTPSDQGYHDSISTRHPFDSNMSHGMIKSSPLPTTFMEPLPLWYDETTSARHLPSISELFFENGHIENQSPHTTRSPLFSLEDWVFTPELSLEISSKYQSAVDPLVFADAVDSLANSHRHTISPFSVAPDPSPLPLADPQYQTINTQGESIDITQAQFPKAVEPSGSALLQRSVNDGEIARFPLYNAYCSFGHFL